MKVAPGNVHETLKKAMLVEGYPHVLDLEKSHGSYLYDAREGVEYLDFFTFYSSRPLGFNHPGLATKEFLERAMLAAKTKPSNGDMYTTLFAEFAETFRTKALGPGMKYLFYIDGGGLAVENALKAAFDWKARKNMAAGLGEEPGKVLHFRHAFHGRTGYTLSVTNTDPVKTDLFPKFPWPRISCPAIRFPLEGKSLDAVIHAEQRAVSEIERAFDESPDDIAAILIEPIQAEGGDNHFRAEFLHHLRRIANEREALLIFDEVQTGMGLTGKWWAYEHFGVVPDILCFAKKMQVGGIFASRRLDEVPDNVFHVPSRINSTFGANLVDMVRTTHVLEVIVNENLVENAALRGAELRAGLEGLEARYPSVVTNARGRGLMCAIDLPSTELRNRVVRRCFEDEMIVLKCGSHSIRFRPTLTVGPDAIAEGVRRLGQAIGEAVS